MGRGRHGGIVVVVFVVKSRRFLVRHRAAPVFIVGVLMRLIAVGGGTVIRGSGHTPISIPIAARRRAAVAVLQDLGRQGKHSSCYQ